MKECIPKAVVLIATIVSGAKLLKSDWFRGVRLIVNRTKLPRLQICTALASFFDKKEYEVFRNVC